MLWSGIWVINSFFSGTAGRTMSTFNAAPRWRGITTSRASISTTSSGTSAPSSGPTSGTSRGKREFSRLKSRKKTFVLVSLCSNMFPWFTMNSLHMQINTRLASECQRIQKTSFLFVLFYFSVLSCVRNIFHHNNGF